MMSGASCCKSQSIERPCAQEQQLGQRPNEGQLATSYYENLAHGGMGDPYTKDGVPWRTKIDQRLNDHR